MDTMALLCNLYGNGPATLRRLRDAGCTTVEGLERAGIDQLSEWLADSPDAARRFLREAQRLNARVAPVVPVVPVIMEAVLPSTPGVPTAVADGDYDEEFEGGDDDEYEDEDEDEEFEDEDDDDEDDDDDDKEDPYGDEEYEEEDAYAEEREDPRVAAHAERAELVTRALEAWRTRDHELAPVQGTRAPVEGDEPLPAESAPLEAEMLEGLDAACVGSLAARGVESLESLATAEVDSLAPAMGLRLTRLLRLRYLARTALSTGAGKPRARTQASPLARPLTREGAGPALRAAQRAPSVIQPAPGPGAAAAVARTTPPTVRFSPSERPPRDIGDMGDIGRLEDELVAAGMVHHGPHTLKGPHTPGRRGEPGAAPLSGGPFA